MGGSRGCRENSRYTPVATTRASYATSGGVNKQEQTTQQRHYRVLGFSQETCGRLNLATAEADRREKNMLMNIMVTFTEVQRIDRNFLSSLSPQDPNFRNMMLQKETQQQQRKTIAAQLM